MKSIPPPAEGQHHVLIEDAEQRFSLSLSHYDGQLPAWCSDPKGNLELVAIVTARRTKQYRLRCMACGHSNLFNVAHKMLNHSEREMARIVRVNDENTEPSSQGICEVCGFAGYVECHHWAPRGVFKDEAEDWPMAMLCRKCHVYWHQKMAGRK